MAKETIEEGTGPAGAASRSSGLDNGKTGVRGAGSGYDLRILNFLRRITRAVDIQSRKVAAVYGITVPQVVCLVKIVEEGSTTITSLSKSVYLSSSTVVGILDRLEEKGLIERRRDRVDRRLVHLTATKKGRDLVDKTPSLVQESLCNAFRDLPELEQATIALSLERIVELMEAPELEVVPILDLPVEQGGES
ncbi:MAG: MarR family transcriptional regulator [Candidatus Glassbacteria bacterium]|nr:MarR family transcriptional regulator [Candidatus Glassbacteria bacterium]